MAWSVNGTKILDFASAATSLDLFRSTDVLYHPNPMSPQKTELSMIPTSKIDSRVPLLLPSYLKFKNS